MTSEDKVDLLARCRVQVSVRSTRRGWGLDAQEVEALATTILQYVAADDLDATIGDIVEYYVDERPHVIALLDHWQPEYEQAWQTWYNTTQLLLRRYGLLWMRDRAIEDADVVQEGVGALVKALPSYGYRSRFRVWAAHVVLNRARAMIEQSQAGKRRGHTVSFEIDEHADLKPEPSLVEDRVLGRLFMLQAAQALGASERQRRLWRVMLLHACDDQTFRAISTVLGVSAKRAKVLYDQAVAILRDHPEVRAWLEAQVESQPDKQSTADELPNE